MAQGFATAQRLRSRIGAYVVAVVAVAVAVVMRAFLDPWLGDLLALVTLYGAVAISVWVGGLGPAVLSVVLGYVLCDWLFIAPRGKLDLTNGTDAIGLAAYLFSCMIIIGFGEGLRRALVAAESSRRQVQDANRRKDEFLAMLGHEFRNPLAAIGNAGELLAVHAPRDPACQWASDVIERQVKHLARLLEDLLDVRRLGEGRIALQKGPVILTSVLDSAVETSRPMIDEGRHDLTISLPKEEVWLHADLVRLSQVISNLLNNAAKYTPPAGRIRLVAERQASRLLISVNDNGIGIAREDLSRIFGLFTQLTPSGGRSRNGLGVGLALAKWLTEAHGGSIVARSEGPGRGSTFDVWLPILEERAKPPHT